jgi:hypothetical protein
MINYKQLLTDFGSIAYHHEQIRSFGFGDLPQITNDIETDQEPLYTKMYIVPGPITFNQNQITYQLNLIILDKINNDLSNLSEVMSDTLEIQKDLWTILYQSYTEQYGNFSWNILPQDYPTVTPFLESYETILGGWTMALNVYIPFDYNRCTPPVIDNYGFPQDEPFKSYKLIINDLLEFSRLHEQVHSYGFGDTQQLTNDIITKQEPLYPRLYINPDISKFKSGQIEYSFNVYIIDKLTIDLSNQQDVLSDTLEIAKDLYAKLYLSDFEAEWDAQLQPFYEVTETGVSGWILNVTSKQKSDYNRCVLPTTSFSNGITWEELMNLWKLEAQRWAEVKNDNI